MTTHSIQYRETSARLTCLPCYRDLAMEALHETHARLCDYITRDREFFNSFAPVDCRPGAPRIARHMAAAARRAGTGPMAAVAGAIGLAVVRELVQAGANHVIFENGGDITMYLGYAVTVGIYCGPNGPGELGLRLEPRNRITACCTSSGTVGHSFSYGLGDAAVVLADDPLLADATATALGNRLRCGGARSLAAALKNTPQREIRTMIVAMNGKVAYRGDAPAWVKTRTVLPPEIQEVQHASA